MYGPRGKGGKAAALLQLLGLVLGASEDGERKETAERKEQCYRCQKLGRVAKYCRNPVACLRCAQAHDSRHCAKKDAIRCCANCGGAHAANYRGCSYIKNWSRGDKARRRHETIKKADTAEAVASSPPPAFGGSVVADDMAVPPDAVSEACARVRAAADEEIATLKAAMAEERATLQAELAEARQLMHSLRDTLASQPHPARKKDADTQTAAPSHEGGNTRRSRTDNRRGEEQGNPSRHGGGPLPSLQDAAAEDSVHSFGHSQVLQRPPSSHACRVGSSRCLNRTSRERKPRTRGEDRRRRQLGGCDRS
ncbi:uncharacterized protein LOC126089603 [Schistocerca cancellata]|uniref:uncharacterized protein LOC126089603 n=1 Tax=Schistocerca cancellata TaxID=274614 RepID=UPI002119044F|nr:uncharacterized protein LOC126089603 [Schistocerca cancellata]